MYKCCGSVIQLNNRAIILFTISESTIVLSM